MYLPGQNGGTAVAQLLYGEKNPSGKLAETWPLRYEDVPSAQTFGKQLTEVYAEGTEVGYRYFDRHRIPVRCPFGFGLCKGIRLFLKKINVPKLPKDKKVD